MKAVSRLALGLGALALALLFAGMAPPPPKKDDPVKKFERGIKARRFATIIEAAGAMAESPTQKGVKALVKYGALIDNYEVYVACRDALTAAQSGPARNELTKGLYSAKRVEQRVLCADALGGAPDPGSVEALGRALDDRAKPVRIAAIRGLARIERRECIPPLFERLDEVGGQSGDAEAAELYAALHSLTGHSYDKIEDWRKYWESVGPDFDPKKRHKSDQDPAITRSRDQGKIFDSAIRSTEFVLALDISGSMRVIDLPPGETWKDKQGKPHKWKDPDSTGTRKPHPKSRFEKSRQAFIKFVEALKQQVKFTIIVFGNAKDTKLWKPKAVPASNKNKKDAVKFVKALRFSHAGTRTDMALEMAFQVPGVDSVYLYTDGIPEKRRGGQSVEIPQDEVLKKAKTLNRTRKVKINCYGMSTDRKMQEFLRALAQESGGEYMDIRTCD